QAAASMTSATSVAASKATVSRRSCGLKSSSYSMTGLRVVRRPRGVASRSAEHHLGEGGEDRDWDGAGQDDVVLIVREAARDDHAEPARPDQSGERRGGDDLDGGRADPSEHERHRYREFHPAEHLQRPEPHAAAGLDDPGIDL